MRPIVLAGLVLFVCAAAGGLALWYFGPFENPREAPPPLEARTTSAADHELGLKIAAFCGDCHASPSPGAFPQTAWDDEVQKGFDFYFQSGRTDLALPDFDQTVEWFRSRAPAEIVIPAQESASSPALRFRTATIAVAPDGLDRQPAVSCVRFSSLAPGDGGVLLWCDMRNGEMRTADPRSPDAPSQLWGILSNPAHAEPCDLDGDGRLDLVVADLGRFQPSDHSDGKIVWLRQVADARWEPVVLQAGLGRVADVEPGDFDADGDLDLVVAEFGWSKTGRILLLENLGSAGSTPEFRMTVLDPRHGTIHVTPTDLDGDGRLDFVALISQEHETVVAFLNDGAGGFRSETIFSANEPSFGSSGIQLVDLDGDQDLDVLYTNGDSFDTFYVKPFHSIRWLENRGGFPFEDHRLAIMPGVHRALACDLDGDGDLDIAACSLLPDRMHHRVAKKDFDSVLWLEQTDRGTFLRHSLERGNCEHAALDAGDFDGDGDIDLAVGTFGYSPRIQHPALTLWWNELKEPGDKKPDIE